MPLHLSFDTARFIGANPNTPSGDEFTRWLAEKLQPHGVKFENIHSKGSGLEWDASHSGGRYTVLAEPTGNSWKLTFDKRSKFTERLMGKGQLAPTDPFVWLVENALQAEPDVTNVRRG